MITIIFKNDVKGEYEDYVKYFYGTLKNYFELFPNTEMPLNNFTKEEFEENLNQCKRNLNQSNSHCENSYIGEYLSVTRDGSVISLMKNVEEENKLNIFKQIIKILDNTGGIVQQP